ncbi:hypothetical protein ACE6H2_013834 [Prunus campanulata]
MVPMISEFDSFLLRTLMESDEEQDTFHGVYPEFGAIFMSSSVTKNECFRRRLFGLPSAKGHFVGQVKRGMILFLFEYERRELHGVFQACSDGTMNISPRAYKSSGNQFPAQVKVKQIWRCHPLPESEFSNAIKENYFSKWKFNFGLSKAQVRRLLTLFSPRKVEDQWPPRELARSQEPSPVYATAKFREVDEGRSILSDKVNNEIDADNSTEPMRTQYMGTSFENVGREDGGRLETDKVDNKAGEIVQSANFGRFLDKVGKVDTNFIVYERAQNELNVDIEHVASMSTEYPKLSQSGLGGDAMVMQGMAANVNYLDVEIGPATSTQNLRYPFEKVRIDDDSRFLTSGKLQIGNSEGNGFGPAISSEYPAFFQSSLDTPVCPGMPVQEAGSLIQDQTRSTSTVSHQMELQITSHSYTASYGDAIVTTTLPYDPDALTLNRLCSPSMGVNHSSNSDQDCYDQAGIPSLRNQAYPLYTEPNTTNRSLGGTSKFDVRVPFTAPDHYERSCHGNIMPFPGMVYSEEMALESTGRHSYGEPFLKPSLAPEALSGSNRREIKSPSSYPSFVIDSGHSVASQDKIDHEIAHKVKFKPFTSSVTSPEELERQLQRRVHPGDRGSVDHHEHKSFDPDLKSFETSEGRSSDLVNNRSVFSRLGLNSDKHVKKNSTDAAYEENDKDSSVDEVMSMLSESLYDWVKSKKSKPPTRRHDVEKFRNKKQTTVHSELDSNYLEMISEKSNMISATPTEDKDDQRSEEIPFVDFKRRSKLRKFNGDDKARANDESAGSDGVLGGQRKRRKLIRPNFSDNEPLDKRKIANTSLIVQVSSKESSVGEDANGKRWKLVRPTFGENEPCDEKITEENSSMILQLSSQQCSISEDAGGICEDSVGSQVKLLPQGAQLSCVVSQGSHENENIETERYPNYEIEVKVESSGASLEIEKEGGKEPHHGVGSQIASLAIPKLFLQSTGLSHVVYQSRENENIETEGSPKYEREIKVESSGTSPRIGDEGRKEPLHDVGSPIARLAIPYKDNNPNIQNDLEYKDPTFNRLPQDCYENSQFTVKESALQIPKPNSGTANEFSVFECGRDNELELLPRVELCLNNADLSIGNVGSSRNLHSEVERVAKEVAICVDAGIGNNHHGSNDIQSEASLNTDGCFNKQEPSQEHRSSKLYEASFGTAGRLNKPKPSQEVQDLNVRFGERLFILSNGLKNFERDASKHVGEKRDVLPISRGIVCKSSDIGTSENVEERKDVLPSSRRVRRGELRRAYNRSETDTSKHVVDRNDVLPISGCSKSSDTDTSEPVEDRKDVIRSSDGVRKCELKTTYDHSEIDTSKHVSSQKDAIPINGGDVCKSSDIGTALNVEDREGALQSSGGIRNSELKTAHNQNTRLTRDFEFDDASANVDSERENKRLWSILTSRLNNLKNAQQQ